MAWSTAALASTWTGATVPTTVGRALTVPYARAGSSPGPGRRPLRAGLPGRAIRRPRGMNTTARRRSENQWQAGPAHGEDRGMSNFLETDRLVLRAFTAADIDHLLALDNDPEVMRFINGGRPTSREAIETRTLPRLLHDYPCWRTRGYWAAQEKSTGTFLGWFEFRPLEEHSPAVVELGYRLNQATWGRGYATEGSRALVHKHGEVEYELTRTEWEQHR